MLAFLLFLVAVARKARPLFLELDVLEALGLASTAFLAAATLVVALVVVLLLLLFSSVVVAHEILPSSFAERTTREPVGASLSFISKRWPYDASASVLFQNPDRAHRGSKALRLLGRRIDERQTHATDRETVERERLFHEDGVRGLEETVH